MHTLKVASTKGRLHMSSHQPQTIGNTPISATVSNETLTTT